MCPDVSRLEDLVVGKLDESESDQLLAHVESCPRCAALLQESEGRPRDSVVRAARTPLQVAPEVSQGETDLQRAMARAKEISPGTSAWRRDGSVATPTRTGGEDDVASFLSPPRSEGELGWLGPYRVLKVLGAGGMGIVFQAEDPKLRRLVALKVMKPRSAAIPGAAQRFLREAQAVARLKSDHIVAIYQVDEANGVPFLAMEYLEGCSLAHRLEAVGRLSSDESLHLALQITRGLETAHKHNIIHRDIKPDNIWLERTEVGGVVSNRAKILDFGLARAWSEAEENTRLTQEGVIVGTPSYMAPEQARSEEVDARTDLFSLGSMLYRMVTGKRPFEGRDGMSILFAVVQHVPENPSQICADVPAAFSDLILKLMEKQPKDRFSSASEVSAALSRLRTEGRSSHDMPPAAFSEKVLIVAPAAQPVAPRMRSKAKPWRWAAAACLVTGVAVLIGAFSFGDREPPAPPDKPPPDKADKAPPIVAKEEPRAPTHLALDGKTQFHLPELPIDLNSGLTIEAFARPDQAGSYRWIFSAEPEFGLRYRGAGTWQFFGISAFNLESGPTPLMQRVHVAGVIGGGKVRLYVNGRLAGEKQIDASNLPALKAASLRLGRDFVGQLDEIRISKSARYDSDFVPKQNLIADDHTLALYHGEVAGDRLLDASGNERSAQVLVPGPQKITPVREEKPFVVTTKQGPRSYQSLAAALFEFPGEAIDVRGDGPFALGPLDLQGSPLVLRAAPGFRPRFVAHEISGQHATWFRNAKEVILHGCDFDGRQSKPLTDLQNLGFLMYPTGKVEIQGCRFVAFKAFLSVNNQQVSIRDSLIDCTAFCHLVGQSRLELENNLIHYRQPLHLTGLGGQQLVLKRNTILYWGGSGNSQSQSGPILIAPETKGVTVEATANIFDFASSYMGRELPVGGDAWKGRLTWTGSNNLYRALGQADQRGLAEWNRYLETPEKDSRETDDLRLAFLDPALSTPEGLQALLRQKVTEARTSHALPDVGPDLSLVGPGEPYARVLKAAQPALELRPDPPTGGPVVLVRSGAPAKGFQKLADAFKQAAHGDIVEIRSDRQFEGVETGADRGTLVVRAGPGYSPTIDSKSFVVSAGTSVSFEGLTFTQKGRLASRPVDNYTGRIVEVRNCTFPQDASSINAVLGSQEFPGRISNCIVAGPLEVLARPGTVIVENSLAPAVTLRTLEAGEYTLDIRRCAIWGGDYYGRRTTIESRSRPQTAAADLVRVKLSSSLVCGHQGLTHVYPSKFLCESQGNVFLCAGEFVLNRNTFGLGSWQMQKEVSEQGSFESEPPLWDPLNWRLLPGSGGQGADVGADCTRVGKLAAPPKVSPAEPESPPKQLVKPFLVTRKGAAPQAFTSLVAAVSASHVDDVIEVHSNGPFVLETTIVHGDALTIRAAPGFRPKFLMRSLETLKGKMSAWFMGMNKVTLEGCDFDGRQTQPVQHLMTVHLLQGPFDQVDIRGCRITGLDVVVHAGSSRLTVRDSLIDAVALFSLPDRSITHLENNLLHFRHKVACMGSGQRITLKNNTLLYWGGDGRFLAGPVVLEPESRDVQVEASGNIIDFAGAWAGREWPVAGDDWKGRLTWKGDHNLYRGIGRKTTRGLADWNSYLETPETDSRETSELRLAIHELGLMSADAMLDTVRRLVEDARKTQKLPDLGPDFARLGPGEAYVRALEAEGVKIDALRPEPLGGGPIVLLRGGSPAGSWSMLKNAFDQCKDGDVIEIRADRELRGAAISQDRGLITLQAAPGYSPVITSNIEVQPGTSLRVAGLTFKGSHLVSQGTDKNLGRVVSVRNCFFLNSAALSQALIAGPGDEPGRISHCYSNTTLDCVVPSRKIVVENSLSRTMSLMNVDRGVVSWEIRRCAFSGEEMSSTVNKFNLTSFRKVTVGTNREPQQPNFEQLQLHVADSFLAGRQGLMHFPCPFGWRGERNCYMASGSWYVTRPFSGLARWMLAPEVTEQGSCEIDPPLWNPRNWRLLPGSPAIGQGVDGADIGADTRRVAPVP